MPICTFRHAKNGRQREFFFQTMLDAPSIGDPHPDEPAWIRVPEGAYQTPVVEGSACKLISLPRWDKKAAKAGAHFDAKGVPHFETEREAKERVAMGDGVLDWDRERRKPTGKVSRGRSGRLPE